MGKRDIAAEVSTGITTKYSFVDDSFDKYFCIASGLEGFTYCGGASCNI